MEERNQKINCEHPLTDQNLNYFVDLLHGEVLPGELDLPLGHVAIVVFEVCGTDRGDE